MINIKENTLRCRFCKKEFTNETTLDEFLDHMSNHDEDYYVDIMKNIELRDENDWS